MPDSVKVTTKSGKTQYRPRFYSEDDYMDSANNSEGFCVSCGEFADGVEPDARQYECESCGRRSVYGIEELMLMGGVYLGHGPWGM